MKVHSFTHRKGRTTIFANRRRHHVLTAAVVGLTALAALAGCASSSDLTDQEESLGGPSPAPATNMPAVADVTPAGTVVDAEHWAVVQITPDGSLRPSTLAIKAGELRKGDPDDLKDVTMLNGSSDDTAGTPYYVNYSWVLLDGTDSAYPNQSITALNSATGDTGSTLLVPDDYEKCTNRGTGQFGGKDVVNIECSVNVFAAGAPDRLVFDGDSSDWQGAKAIQLTIPST